MLSNWFDGHRMRAIALAFSCGVLVAINSTALAGASISIEWGKGGEPVKQKSVKKHSKTGPPSHAPAHGYRAKHQYRYYPSHSVYYDTARGLYFFLESDLPRKTDLIILDRHPAWSTYRRFPKHGTTRARMSGFEPPTV